jgi:hypothetical protein
MALPLSRSGEWESWSHAFQCVVNFTSLSYMYLFFCLTSQRREIFLNRGACDEVAPYSLERKTCMNLV